MALRTLVRGALVLVALAALAAAGFALYAGVKYRAALARFTERFGEPDFAALAVAEIPLESNAATWLLRGVEALADDEESRRELVRLSVLEPDQWSAEDSATAARALAEQRRGLDLLRRAAACRAGNFEIDYSLGMDAPVPDYAALLRASRVLVVDARAALARGDGAAAQLDLGTLASMIEALASDSMLISTLIAFAVDRQYLALARDLLAAWPDDPDLLASLGRQLSRRDLQETARSGLHGEGALIVSSGSQLTLGHDRAALDGLRALAYLPIERLFKADLLDDYSEFGPALSLPWPELQPLLAHRVENPRFWNRYVNLLVHVEDMAGRMKALESSYGLARAAVRYAGTRALPHLGLDPLSGREAIATPLPDGGYTFSSPGGDALWRELQPTPAATTPLPFDWPVPLS